MKFTPFQRYTLRSPLSVSDSKQRLQEALDSPKKWLYFKYDSGAYDGEITGDEFTIFQVASLHAPKLPDIRGRFSAADGTTVIDVRIALYKWKLRIAGCALGFVLICFIGTLWSNWSHTHNIRSTCVGLLFLVGSLLVFYSVIFLNILLLAAQSKKFLRKLLDAA